MPGFSPKMVVEPAQLRWPDAEVRPQAVVGVVGVRDDGVQAVVAARQLEHDEDAVAAPSCARAAGDQPASGSARPEASSARRRRCGCAWGCGAGCSVRGSDCEGVSSCERPSVASAELVVGAAHHQVQHHAQSVFHVGAAHGRCGRCRARVSGSRPGLPVGGRPASRRRSGARAGRPPRRWCARRRRAPCRRGRRARRSRGIGLITSTAFCQPR